MPGARIDVGGEVDTAVSLVVEDGRITRIYAIRNPHKLGRLDKVAELQRAERAGRELGSARRRPIGARGARRCLLPPPPVPEEVSVSVDDGIATLLLRRPAKRNAVTYDMWLAIAEHCRALARDPSVRVLLVRGEGAHFCAGADIAGLADTDQAQYQRDNAAADEALASFPKPTIAVITGACVGGGTELAVACDLRIADATARFGITPARLGLVYPAPAVARVVRLIGPSLAKHLLYSAELIDGERALRIGLIDELHPPGELERPRGRAGRPAGPQAVAAHPDGQQGDGRRGGRAGQCSRGRGRPVGGHLGGQR